MQASKIKTQETYAVREKGKPEGKLLRFFVDAVVQRRVRNTGSPHDYTATVEGHVLEGKDRRTMTLKPDDILGEYEKYSELVAREKAEKDKREAEAKAKDEKADALVNFLYDVTG